MKRLHFLHKLLLLALFWASGTSLMAQILSWEYDNVLTDLQQSGANPDMIVDAAGNLHLSYWLRTEGKLVYAKRNKSNGQWTYETIPDEGLYGYKSALTLDAGGAVHIAYLQKQGAKAWLHYATNASGSWQSSQIFDASDLGPYDEGISFPRFFKHSLDISIQPNGKPAVMFFNGNIYNVIPCSSIPSGNSYNLYDLSLNMVAQQANGSWTYFPLPGLPYNEPFGCLPGDDRLGEFCQMLPGANGSMYAAANATHSGELIWARSAPNNYSNWSYFRADSLERVFNAALPSSSFYEGFDDIVFDQSPDGRIHVIYIISSLFGKLSTVDSRKRFIYTRFHPDSLANPSYQPFYKEITSQDGYKNHFALTAKSADSVYIAYHSANNSDVIVSSTTNGGQTWNPFTLLNSRVSSKMKMTHHQDSLYLLVYHEDRDYLSLSRRSFSNPTWITSSATTTEVRATYLDSKIERVGADDRIYMAFDEVQSGSVLYGERQNGSWTYQTLVSGLSSIKGVAMSRYSNGEPVVVYVDEGNLQLQFAWRNNGTWQISTVQSGESFRDPQLLIDNGVAHLSYYVSSQGELRHASLGSPGANWAVELVDNTSLVVGQYPSLTVDNGTLYLAYVDAFNARLKMGTLPVGGSWSFSFVTQPQAHIPVFPSIRINQQGNPVIAFRDAGTNKIMVMTYDGNGDWVLDPVTGDITNLVGAPLQLILDDKDRPWVLYNYLTSTDELRLVRLDGDDVWNQVSVINNANQIANSFDFHLVDQDFYIVGKQNRAGQNGIGLLHAVDGVNTRLENTLAGTALALYPNPATGLATLGIRFALPQSQEISAALYNLQGQKLHTIRETDWLAAGQHQWDWTLPALNPGMYFVVLRSAKATTTQKLLIQP